MRRTGLPPRELEYWIIRKSGERCCINNRYTPRIENGVMTGCIIVTTDVTERRKAEESLKMSESLFRTIVESSPVPMVVTKIDDDEILYASRQFGRFLGWKPNSIVGKNCADFFLQKEQYYGLRERVKEEAFVEGLEIQLCDIDGRPFWAAASLRKLTVASESVVLGGFMDINERKIEEDLSKLQTEFSAAVGDLRSLKATFEYILSSALAMSGMEVGLLARCSSDDIHPIVTCSKGLNDESLELFIKKPPMALCHTKNCTAKFTILNKIDDRHPFYEAANFATICLLPVPLDDGSSGCLLLGSEDEKLIPQVVQKRLAHFAAHLSSFIARARAEEALRLSELRHRTLLDTMPDTILRISHEGTFLDIHEPPSAKLFERFNSLVGKGIYEILSPRLAEHFTVAIKNVFETGTIEVFEDVWDQPEGVLWVEVRVTQSDDNEVQAIVRDVTDRHRVEEERINIEKQMQQRQKLESLGVLAGGIAHDFNNLLQTIMGNVSLAKLEAEEEIDIIENLEQIDEAARSAAALTKQMLAYGGKGRFLVRPLSLSTIIENMCPLIEASVAKRAKLSFDLTKDLPKVEGDSHQVSQVVMNLVANAAEAQKNSKGTITISTKVINANEDYLSEFIHHAPMEEGDFVLLSVEDEGLGMDQATLDRACEPFFTTKFTGRGLGLAAVHGIVRGHGGAFSITSAENNGTSVKILFPIFKGKEKTVKRATAPPKEWSGSGTILVVDDDRSIRLVARKILQGVGFSVLPAKDGNEALEIFTEREKEIVLVILDMTMPNMDGAETFEKIQKINDGVPVVLVSGYDEQETKRRFTGAGLAGFIQKPFDRNILLETIKEVLSPQKTD